MSLFPHQVDRILGEIIDIVKNTQSILNILKVL